MGDSWRDMDAYLSSMKKLNKIRVRFDVVYTPHGGFPVSSDILEGLIRGARRCLNGEVEGVDTDFVKNSKMYDVGVARLVAGTSQSFLFVIARRWRECRAGLTNTVTAEMALYFGCQTMFGLYSK